MENSLIKPNSSILTELGRSSLEEVYKKASGYNWQASIDPKFNQLQQMRISTSAFLPYDQHKKKQQEDKTDSIKSQAKAKATPSKSPSQTRRAKSVPPRKKSTSGNTTTTATKTTQPPSTTTTQPAKVWIKPKAKETPTDANKETNANKVQRPANNNNNLNKELKQAQQKQTAHSTVNGRASPPILRSGPVRTTQIKTPEELSGIKSPPAANFLEQFDNEPINWTNPSINSNGTYSNLMMNEFNPTSIRSDNLADLSGLKI